MSDGPTFPTDEQITTLREAGWTLVSTLDGVRATYPDRPTLPWHEALELAEEQES